MARSTISTEAADPVRPYLEGVAKHLVERIYGKDGPKWGTKLTEIEDMLLAVRQALTEEMLQEALRRQANTAETRPAPFLNCPKCGQEVDPEEDSPPRILQTRVGEAKWNEPTTYCRDCRRSFFPSDQKLGH
jgi:hypothetical protein